MKVRNALNKWFFFLENKKVWYLKRRIWQTNNKTTIKTLWCYTVYFNIYPKLGNKLRSMIWGAGRPKEARWNQDLAEIMIKLEAYATFPSGRSHETRKIQPFIHFWWWGYKINNTISFYNLLELYYIILPDLYYIITINYHLIC